MIGFITLCVKRHICLVKQVTQTIIFSYHKRMDCRVIQKLETIVNVCGRCSQIQVFGCAYLIKT